MTFESGAARDGPTVTVIDLCAMRFSDTIDSQKPYIVRRELVLDARIAEPDDQFQIALSPWGSTHSSELRA
jgi:hypothetical protein